MHKQYIDWCVQIYIFIQMMPVKVNNGKNVHHTKNNYMILYIGLVRIVINNIINYQGTQ